MTKTKELTGPKSTKTKAKKTRKYTRRATKFEDYRIQSNIKLPNSVYGKSTITTMKTGESFEFMKSQTPSSIKKALKCVKKLSKNGKRYIAGPNGSGIRIWRVS